jgi:hypothetical protein
VALNNELTSVIWRSTLMSPITHFLMGWAVANSAPSLSKRDRALVI